MRLPKKFAQKSRKAFYFIHLWTGLIIGLWFVMMGLTGSALAWRTEIAEWETRQRVCAPRLNPGEKIIPASKAVAALQAAYPDVNVGRGLNVPNERGGYYSVIIRERGKGDERTTTVYLINPVTAKVYPSVDRGTLWIDITEHLHWSLLLGVNGVRTNGFLTLFTLFMLVSGVWLWWPSNVKQLKQRLTWKRGVNLRRTLYDLHNMMGVYLFPMLLLLVVTGVVICYNGQTEQSIRRGVNRLRGVEDAPRFREGGEGSGEGRGRSARTGAVRGEGRGADGAGRGEEPLAFNGRQPLDIDAMVQKARQAMPNNTLVSIRLPRRPGQPFSASYDRFLLDGTGVSFDAYTGKMLDGNGPAAEPANPGNTFMSYMFQLHYGWFGGNWSKVLYFISGFMPLGLFITGLWMWARKKKSQSEGKRKAKLKSTLKTRTEEKAKSEEPVAV